ncbi:hypothetical protein Mal64_18390 [Pseudobythopirellula maris]|uniref:PEP-CTERM protein-sorting domain-containing protein n=1 Tax=Pseudobythopirellula maris TaxID=2527991 RepID=A0A5C5ZLT1_9BACT|nr:hypothetical protein [Pseudobythopirellula maris]TWT88359.1 hypothetical protein Mal64_18390 [Pseudobythopirellula maris]
MRYKTVVAAVLAIFGFGNACPGTPLRPGDFLSLGPLPAGGFEIDTDALTFGGAAGGVLHTQGGGAPDIAVFVFDGGGVLASGDNITVTGGNALALLFQGSATLAGTIDVSGANGLDAIQNVVTGIGGSGVAGGGRGGNGGPFSSGQDGVGPGRGVAGSSSASVSGVGSGAGAGFGTMGGQGGAGVTTREGGAPYGDPLRDLLFAGSGGGGGGGQSNQRLGGGGGAGGGALEIGAQTSLGFVGATILANGGDGANGFADGGGGSGGAIVLHGFEVSVDLNSLIQASGGVGGEVPNMGGCGGAGRIEILHHPDGEFVDLGVIEAHAGAAGDCVDGEPVLTISADVGVPEPSGLATAVLLLGLGGRRLGPGGRRAARSE